MIYTNTRHIPMIWDTPQVGNDRKTQIIHIDELGFKVWKARSKDKSVRGERTMRIVERAGKKHHLKTAKT